MLTIMRFCIIWYMVRRSSSTAALYMLRAARSERPLELSPTMQYMYSVQIACCW